MGNSIISSVIFTHVAVGREVGRVNYDVILPSPWDIGCLPFSQIIRMEWSLHKGKRFAKFIDLPDENGAYLLDLVWKAWKRKDSRKW